MPAEVHALLASPSTAMAVGCHDDPVPDHPVQHANPCDMGLCCLCPATLPTVSPTPVQTIATDRHGIGVPRPLWPIPLDGIFHPPRA